MIAYHGTPISGDEIQRTRFLKGRHALVSWHHPKDMELVAEVSTSFVLDNGAYSFWSNKKQPNWDAYLAWVLEWYQHPCFDWWLIPDVIDGTEDDNWRLIFHYGRALPYGVPVYHLHESMYHLERLVNNFPRIALGSSGQWSTPGTAAWWKRMAEVMDVICTSDGKPRCKLHGLRMLNPDVYRYLPLASADSSNAARNAGDTDRWHGCYKPPTTAQRAEVLAWRIEHYNSAASWAGKPERLNP